MEKTVPHPHFGQTHIGYVLNTPFSEAGQSAIQQLQEKYVAEFGDAVYIPPADTLHITLMDWLAPLVDYGQDKDRIFEEIFPKYDAVLEESVKGVGSIAVRFNTVAAGAEAVFVKGEDDGQYVKIRDGFLERVELLPNTKQPPKIIHSTIARYLKPIDLQAVQDFSAEQTIDFTETIDYFRLFRSTNTTMQALRIIKRYNLK